MKRNLSENDLEYLYYDHTQANDAWLNSREAAEYLNVTIPVLMNLTSSSKVPYYKLGKRNRYLRSELESLIKKEARGVRDGNSL